MIVRSGVRHFDDDILFPLEVWVRQDLGIRTTDFRGFDLRHRTPNLKSANRDLGPAKVVATAERLRVPLV